MTPFTRLLEAAEKETGEPLVRYLIEALDNSFSGRVTKEREYWITRAFALFSMLLATGTVADLGPYLAAVEHSRFKQALPKILRMVQYYGEAK